MFLFNFLNFLYVLEDRLRKSWPTLMVFVDLEEGFDNVKWNTSLRILKWTGIKYREKKSYL